MKLPRIAPVLTLALAAASALLASGGRQSSHLPPAQLAVAESSPVVVGGYATSYLPQGLRYLGTRNELVTLNRSYKNPLSPLATPLTTASWSEQTTTGPEGFVAAGDGPVARALSISISRPPLADTAERMSVVKGQLDYARAMAGEHSASTDLGMGVAFAADGGWATLVLGSADGTLIQVSGIGLGEDELVRVANGLETAK